jgi:putative serine protease PepD
MFKNVLLGLSVLCCASAIAQQRIPSFPTLGLALYERPNESPSVAVAQVGEGTPAAAAGLVRGDFVVRLGERPINRVTDVIAALDQLAPGASIEMVVRRGAQEQTLQVTPGPAQYHLSQ